MSCPTGSFYLRRTEVVAKELIGKKLVRTISEGATKVRLAGIIVETEAYGHIDDEASHAYIGKTARNAVMFGEVGKAYVYFTYGNHFCINVSARSSKAYAGAVLIRGLEPVEGIDVMKQFRPVNNILSLTSGPGKLTQALRINSLFNGVDMTDIRSELHIESGINRTRIISTPRIGISKAIDKNWRFFDPSSRFVSQKVHPQLKVQ